MVLPQKIFKIMEKTKKGIQEDTLHLTAGATFLLLFFIDVNLDGVLERVLYFLGVPIATGYIFNYIGRDLDEEKEQAIASVLVYVVGALIIALLINGFINEEKTMKACSDGNQDACEALEYTREQREDYRE